MIDYISREDAKLHIFEYGVRHRDNGSIASACENLERQMNSIPAADVRPVVLCKDCKNDCHCMIQDFMEDYGITPDDQNNFFCGYGEREGN